MTGSRLGFIGTGRMGGLMAARLIAAGHQLTVCDSSDAAVAPLVSAGARRGKTAAEVASEADIVFASLPTPDVVRLVALGPGGVIEGGRVKTFIDLSTTGPRVAAAVSAGLAAKGITSVDAPVSGGMAGARNGTLAVMVSGPRASYDALEPILKIFGKLFFIGEKPGAAQTMKLVNNLLAACSLAITCEGMVMGAKAGLDAKVMIDVLNVSSGRSSATHDKFPRAILPRTFDFGFATGLSHKDVRLCLDEAEALGVPMIVGSAVRQVLAITSALYGPDSDFTSMVKCAEQWAGAEVRG
jgi:3-hydroxyisobutyrate dehydrogenase-like beta-hydroxyacid dehydrogenase